MAEAELHKERLQAIAEKRKRQTEIEQKRHQLEDQILQLQHFKSKALREKWLLQGTQAANAEEEEARRKQSEEDERKVKRLEDNIQRLEQEIDQLESEEFQISAKEQIIREKLRETEKSIEDLQKSLSNQDGAVYAMEINVEKDKQTGETKILSTSTIGPEGVHQRGVKVYDDGRKVVYEVHSGGTVVENGVHQLSSRDVDELIQRATQSNTRPGSEAVTVSQRTVRIDGNPVLRKEQMFFKEAKLEKVHGSGENPGHEKGEVSVDEIPNASTDQPVTMIFMGYQNIEDEEETKKVLGYDGTMKAELVLIDEDDEKSLREKTVTDISTLDGNAADLVSGRPQSDTTEPSMSEGREESTVKEPAAGLEEISVPKNRSLESSCQCARPEAVLTLEKSSARFSEDERELKKDRERYSATFLDPVCILHKQTGKMEIEIPLSDSQDIKLEIPTDAEDNQGDYFSIGSTHNGLKSRNESLDSDVANEIRYLDEVLEANCSDSVVENSINGTSSPEPSAITIGGSSPSVMISDDFISTDNMVAVIGGKQTPFTELQENIKVESHEMKSNGHSSDILKEEPYRNMTTPESPGSSTSSRRSSRDGEMSITTIKKEAKFELRAFHEDKKPAKLFDEEDNKETYRVRKVRPNEEVVELERERRELIKSQAVKKNPSIATKWWNPPQEKSIEEQLDQENLESHRKYKERKQKQQEHGTAPAMPAAPKEKSCTFVPQEPISVKKEDIVTEQIDFSAARKQFLLMENSSQSSSQVAPKRSIAPKLFSAKPFLKAADTPKLDKFTASVTGLAVACGQTVQIEANEVTVVKAQRVDCVSDDQQISPQDVTSEPMNELSYITVENSKQEQAPKSCMHDDEFTSVRAVFTVLKDDDHEISDHLSKSVQVSYHQEELDSGLDELSLRSQDTAVLETLSNDFSMDNISDSGASNETMNVFHDNSLGDFSQPQTPQADMPSDHRIDGVSKSFSDHGFYSFHSPCPETVPTDEQLEYHAGILVQNVIQQAIAEQRGIVDSDNQKDLLEHKSPDEQQEKTRPLSPDEEQTSKFEPPQVSSPVQEKRDTMPKSSAERDLELRDRDHAQQISPEPVAIQYSPTEVARQEFSYFSKYSEAAELRSTASVVGAQESEVTMGPFRLRSKKQRTLSMIEEEIRAAQEREEELKRQRQKIQTVQSPVRKNAPSLPTRTICHTKTAPGKIEKIQTPPSPTAEGHPLQVEFAAEDASGNQRPKTLMQTLLQDYESHKTKRREMVDDSSVLEATRVGRRKSAMALRWEAGIYANREDDDE